MSDSGYQVVWHAAAQDLPATLWDQCFPTPLEGRWWYQALDDSGLEDQFRFLYGLVTGGGEPLGIAPAFLMDVPMQLVLPPALMPMARLLGRICPSLLYQRTLFLGSPCADEGTLGLLPGVDRHRAMTAVVRAMRREARRMKAPMLVWKDFPPSCDEDLAVLARSEGMFPLVSFPGSIVRLAGPTKADYLAALKASRRNKLKKKLKQATPVDVDVLSQPEARTLDEIFSLFWQTYEKGATKFERLNRKFFDLVAGQPHAYFIVLREQATASVVAFMLCFSLGDHVINKFIGIDYQKPKEWFLYFRLWDAAVDWSLSRGAKAIQSGQTGYAPKIEIGHELVPLTNYCAHRNPLIHRIYARVARTVGWETLDEDLAVYLAAYPELRPAIQV